MAQEQEQSRTEEATAYKLEQARKKGTVARSQELSTFVVLLALAGYLWAMGGSTAADVQALASRALAQAPSLAFGPAELWLWTVAVAQRMAYLVLPILLVAAAAAMLTSLLQTGFIFSVHALKPDFTRLNPANGFKRIFSVQALYESSRSVLKLAAYTGLAYLVIMGAALQALQVPSEPRAVAALIGGQALMLLFWMLGVMLLFAVIDVLFVKRQYARKMMMSRRELREEMRQREGDSRIKQRRRQLAQELLKRSRSMRQLRGADVLVTNPTHFAVGLRYEPQRMWAPQVVSKGAGEFALRLRRLAFVYGVPVLEDRKLARALFFGVPLDSAIQDKHFKPTAALYLRLRTARDGRAAHAEAA